MERCKRQKNIKISVLAAKNPHHGTKFAAFSAYLFLPKSKMKRLFIIISLLAVTFAAMAQNESRRPVRTPEEEAMKQTEMLQRELMLTEQQHDTIYRIHLKYARLRQVSNTRAEMLERMNAMTAEITNMLTPLQKKLFLGKQIDPTPRRPQCPVVRTSADSTVVK